MSNVESKKTRAIIEAATSPLSLAPFLAGSTGGLAMLALGHAPLLGIAAASVCVVWGVLSAAVRATSSPAILTRVENSILEEKRREQREEASRLRNSLSHKDAPLVSEIISLLNLIESYPPTDMTQRDVLASIQNLLEQSYQTLFKIPMLRELKLSVNSANVSKKVEENTSKIIEGVKANIEYATGVIADIQSLGLNQPVQDELRTQVSARLEAAREFDGQLSSLHLGGISPSLISKYASAGSS